MWDNIISKQLKRGNTNVLVTGIFMALLSVLMLVFTARSSLNEVLGPVTMTPAEVLAVKDPSKLLRYYICTKGSAVSPTIWQDGWLNTDRKTGAKTFTATSDIQLLKLDDGLVLVRRHVSSPDTSIAGALVNVPNDLSVTVAHINASALRSKFRPLLIDSTRFSWGGRITLAIMLPFLIMSVVFIRRAITRLSDKFQNPSILALKRFGDPRSVLSEIEQELRDTDNVYRDSMLWLTKNWLITTNLAGIEIRNVKELVWVYPQTTAHSVNFIPTGNSYGLLICDSAGKYTQVSLPSQHFGTILDVFSARAPWAFYGYDLNYRQMWQSKKRAEMIAQVEERRAAMGK